MKKSLPKISRKKGKKVYNGSLKHFTCDICGADAMVKCFPRGWFTTRPLKHHCDVCVKKLPKGTKIWPEGAKEDEFKKVK